MNEVKKKHIIISFLKRKKKKRTMQKIKGKSSPYKYQFAF